jgi:glycine cleavage system H protein
MELIMNIPANLKYASSHEWVRQETDGTVSVGITHHAQETLGDLVFVENPPVGRKLKQGEECAVVESVKAAADVHAPLSGEVVAANAELDDTPEKINQDPYAAWMFRLKPDNPSELAGLLDAAAYQKIAAAEKH